MPATSYAEYKSETDHNLPTPRVVWRITDAPGPGEFRTRFNDVTYVYRARPSRVGDDATWAVDAVEGEEIVPRTITSNHATWPLCRTAFRTYWNTYCDHARIALATQEHAKYHLGTEGALSVVSDSSALQSLGIQQMGGGMDPSNLSTQFVPDTLDYLFTVSRPSLRLQAFTENADQKVRWAIRNRVVNGLVATFAMNEGENLIRCRVTAQDGYSHRTYTITVTRT